MVINSYQHFIFNPHPAKVWSKLNSITRMAKVWSILTCVCLKARVHVFIKYNVINVVLILANLKIHNIYFHTSTKNSRARIQ